MSRRIARSDPSPSASHDRGISRLSCAGINKTCASRSILNSPREISPPRDARGRYARSVPKINAVAREMTYVKDISLQCSKQFLAEFFVSRCVSILRATLLYSHVSVTMRLAGEI